MEGSKMNILKLIPVLAVTACMSTVQTAHQNYQEKLASCNSMANMDMLSEQEYLQCYESEYAQWYQASDADMSSVYKLLNDDMAVAKKVDAGKLTEDKAKEKYVENKRAYYLRDREFRSNQMNIAQQQESRRRMLFQKNQEYIGLKNRLINECIAEYRASLPVEYDTRCYSGAGYQNCKTTPRRVGEGGHIRTNCELSVKNNLKANGIVSPYGY